MISFLLWPRLGPAYQPAIFWSDIPVWLGRAENGLRIVVIALSVFMPFQLVRRSQRFGFGLYLVGLGVYAASQIIVVLAPGSGWSTSLVGFTAPAFTTLIWMIGIGFIGDRLFFARIPWRKWMYFTLVLAFAAVHSAHAGLVYMRNF